MIAETRGLSVSEKENPVLARLVANTERLIKLEAEVKNHNALLRNLNEVLTDPENGVVVKVTRIETTLKTWPKVITILIAIITLVLTTTQLAKLIEFLH